MKFRTILVIGAGTMGSQVTQLLTSKGCTVRWLPYRSLLQLAGFQPFCEPADPYHAFSLALEGIKANLGRHAAQGHVSEADCAGTLQRIQPVTDIHEMTTGVDLISESIPEDLAAKQQLFRWLDERVPPPIPLTTNTSTLSVAEIACVTAHPARVAGLHFMNPATTNPLMEIVRCDRTAPSLLEDLRTFAKDLGKTPILVEDSAGFVLNRILFQMVNEAAFTLQEGVASAADIDTALRLGAGYPIGPLSLADYIGLDLVLTMLERMEAEHGSRHHPCPLIRRYVRANRLGRKTGQGFFTYPQPVG